MRYLIILALLISGCSGAQLKRCPAQIEDPSIMKCELQVEGAYRMCDAPEHLWRCTDVQ